MLKRSITYTDYNGTERTENFYFNFTEAELAEMELGVEGGFVEMMQRIIDAKDAPTLVKIFKDLVLKAYGKKSDDGRRFIKTEEIKAEFMQTEAYSKLFMELAFNADAASKFMKGVIPEKFNKQESVKAIETKNN